MATADTVGPSTAEDEEDEQPASWILARYGINLLLNNKQDEALKLFKAYPESLDLSAGYAYTIFTVS